MIKSDFTFRRFIDTFVPGFVVVIGLWYLYKPYFNKYFPVIAYDPANIGPTFANDLFAMSNELKLILVLIASVFIGVIVNHFADLPIACIYKHYEMKANMEGRKYIIKAKAHIISVLGCLLLFRFIISDDPRRPAINRYIKSSRRDSFCSMVHEWTKTTISEMKNKKDEVIVHQHICYRIRTINPFTSKLYDDCYSEVIFASSLQVALIILFIATLLLLGLNIYHDTCDPESELTLNFIANKNLIIILILEYALILVVTYSLVRSFRHFSSKVLAIAYQIYISGYSTVSK